MSDPVSIVLAITVLCFFGGLALAMGLHIGWHLATYIVGPLQIKINNNVTTLYKPESSFGELEI